MSTEMAIAMLTTMTMVEWPREKKRPGVSRGRRSRRLRRFRTLSSRSSQGSQLHDEATTRLTDCDGELAKGDKLPRSIINGRNMIRVQSMPQANGLSSALTNHLVI